MRTISEIEIKLQCRAHTCRPAPLATAAFTIQEQPGRRGGTATGISSRTPWEKSVLFSRPDSQLRRRPVTREMHHCWLGGGIAARGRRWTRSGAGGATGAPRWFLACSALRAASPVGGAHAAMLVVRGGGRVRLARGTRRLARRWVALVLTLARPRRAREGSRGFGLSNKRAETRNDSDRTDDVASC
jgi:hypothetical protein